MKFFSDNVAINSYVLGVSVEN